MSYTSSPDAAGAGRTDVPVLALAVLSGICGLGYEVLLARGLPLILGHTTAVSSATIATFLGALALGALAAHRLEPRLPWVEGAAAAIAAVYAAVFAVGPVAVQAALGGVSVAGATVWAIVFAAPPAFVAGAAIPAYSLRGGAAAGSGRTPAFTRVYFLYNLLAAIAILGIDTAAVPAFGLAACFGVLAVINAGVALLVRRAARPEPGALVLREDTRPAAPAVAVVAAMGVAGGMAQVGTIVYAHLSYGMLAGHAAYTVALALIGLSLGVVASRVGRYRPGAVLGGLSVAAAAGLLLAGPSLGAWASGVGALTAAWQAVALKAACLAMVVLPLFTAVGASIPLVAARWPGGPETPGRLLAVAAAGNAVGALAVVFGLLAWLGLSGVFLFALGAIAVAAALAGGRMWAAPAVAVSLIAWLAWPAGDLARPASDLARGLSEQTGGNRVVEVSEIRAFDRIGHLLRRADGSRSVVMTGNGALWVPTETFSATETAIGMIGADTTRAHERALVLGMGTGTTAGTVVDAFARTDVVDASPLAPRLVRRFSESNHGLVKRTGWRLIAADAIQVLAGDGPAYDLVLSTVNSAAYAPAAKIYTREAFQAAARRLTPEGVFVIWIDSGTPRAGRQAIGRALEAVFGGCARYRLNQGYIALACAKDGVPEGGNAPAMPRISDVLAQRGFEDGVSQLVSGLRLGALDWRRFAGAPESRIDPPLLARLMADPRRHLNQSPAFLRDPFFEGAWVRGREACRSAVWMGEWRGCLQDLVPRLCGAEAADLLVEAGLAWGDRRAEVARGLATTLARSGWPARAARILRALAGNDRIAPRRRVAALQDLRRIGQPHGIDAAAYAGRLHDIVQRTGLGAGTTAATPPPPAPTLFARIRSCR